ncbi:MAG: ABC transporter substrate-binding protein [Rhodospirillaceae bacterium]|nr:ABC transporter substrate-binding protein [Rhodospirillaceae bacterium]
MTWLGGLGRGVGRMLALATLLTGLSPAHASGQALRFAITALPVEATHPYRQTGLPTVFILGMLYDALTNIAADGTPQPWLATSWTASSPLTWVFRLREDVVFSNGAPLTAAAVAANINYVISDAAAVETLHIELENVSGARALDNATLEVTTRTPDILLPHLLSMLQIAEPGAWQRLGPQAFARRPIGTGPFRVAEWRASGMMLEAVPSSWLAAKVRELEVLALPEATTRVQALQSGRIDIAMTLGPEDGPALESAGQRLLVYPTGGVMGVSFVTEKAGTPVRDVRVRQALNYAVDKQRIIDGLLGGSAVAVGQPAPRAAFGYNPAAPAYPYDPARAKALLAHAGYADGLRLVMEIVPGTLAADAAIFQQVANDLAQVGIDLSIKITNFATYARHYVSGDWEGDAFGIYFVTDPYLDALRPLKRHSCAWKVPWYCDRPAMDLIKRARTSFDAAERRALTAQVMARYHEQAAALYLHEVAGYMGLSRRVEDFNIVNGFIHFHEISFGPKR